MGDTTIHYPGSLDFPELGKMSPDANLELGHVTNGVTIDLRENDFGAFPFRAQHIFRKRLPPTAHCVSCGAAPSPTLQVCTCGGTVFQIAYREYLRIEDAIFRRQKTNSDGRKWNEALLPGYHTDNDLTKILKIQDGRCYFCGARLMKINGRGPTKNIAQIDHLIAVSASKSSNWPSNIGLVCPTCNTTKQRRSAESFWRQLEKTKDATFVRKRREVARQFDIERRSLDKSRRRQVRIACSMLEDSLREVLRKMKRGGVRIKVECHSYDVVVHLGLVAAVLPGAFHRRVATWNDSRRLTFCRDLINAYRSTGGLVVEPY